MPGGRRIWWSRMVRFLPEKSSPAQDPSRSSRAACATTRRIQRVAFAFPPSVLPAYLRKTNAIEELIPWLYLKGISTGDFGEALQSLVGERAKGLSANVVVRLKAQWANEYDRWCKRDLSNKNYVYVWADGIHVKVRLEDEANKKQCILVLMGATADGKKELISVIDGYRESEQSWKELLLSLKQRGLSTAPKVAVGDGALGFWSALRKTFPETREQRCWVHKTANVLNKMPKSVQPKAKADLHEIWQAETQQEATKAFEVFLEKVRCEIPQRLHLSEQRSRRAPCLL